MTGNVPVNIRKTKRATITQGSKWARATTEDTCTRIFDALYTDYDVKKRAASANAAFVMYTF